MAFTEEKPCIHDKDGDIDDDKLAAVIRMMPKSLNAVGMAKIFFVALDAYDMAGKSQAAAVMNVLLGALAHKDRASRKQKGEDDDEH